MYNFGVASDEFNVDGILWQDAWKSEYFIAGQRLDKHPWKPRGATIEEPVFKQQIGKHNNRGIVGNIVFCGCRLEVI
jgi:hypothetical protein